MSKVIQNIKGTAIAETLLTVSIFSFGALSLINLQTKLIRANSFLFQSMQAMQYANNKIEELRTYKNASEYASITSGKDTITGITAAYLRSWSVTENTSPSFKQVTVNVRWVDRDGSNNSKQVTSNISFSDPVLNAAILSLATQTISNASGLTTTSSIDSLEFTKKSKKGRNKIKKNRA